MSSAAIQQGLAAATLSIGLGAIFVMKLRRSEYGLSIALLLSALILLQPAFCNPSSILKADVFAAVEYAVAITAISLVDRQDARRIALLGGSLAGAQLVHPLWGTTATIMLPLVLRNRMDGGSIAGVTGLYISILFIPAITSAAIFFFDASFRSEILSLASAHSTAHFGLRRTLVSTATILVAATPVLVAVAVQPRSSSPRVIAVIALALMVACTALDALALQFATLSVGFGVLMIPLFAAWQQSGVRARWAISLAVANTAAAWASALMVQAYA